MFDYHNPMVPLPFWWSTKPQWYPPNPQLPSQWASPTMPRWGSLEKVRHNCGAQLVTRWRFDQWLTNDVGVSKLLRFLTVAWNIWYSFWHEISDILTGILTGILSDILSGILSDICSDILSGNLLWNSFSDLLSGIRSGIHSDILSGILSGILVQACPTGSGAGDVTPQCRKKTGSSEGKKKEGMKEGRKGVAPLSKSRDPHLAGGGKKDDPGMHITIYIYNIL